MAAIDVQRQEKRAKKKNKDGQLDLLSQAGNKKENNQEKAYINQVVSSLKKEWADKFDSNIVYYYGVNNESELKEFIRLSYRRNFKYLYKSIL